MTPLLVRLPHLFLRFFTAIRFTLTPSFFVYFSTLSSKTSIQKKPWYGMFVEDQNVELDIYFKNKSDRILEFYVTISTEFIEPAGEFKVNDILTTAILNPMPSDLSPYSEHEYTLPYTGKFWEGQWKLTVYAIDVRSDNNTLAHSTTFFQVHSLDDLFDNYIGIAGG